MEQETQNKSLLIIKSQAQGLGPAEGFLKNRDWKIKTTTNLKEALVYIATEQPQFVMVSIDHPNKKVRKLPKILVQAFPVCVIAFCEQSSAANFQTLTATNAEYTLYPPITGPAVERMVNKYYKDLATKPVQSGGHGLGRNANGLSDSMISIQGGQTSGDNLANILSNMLNDDSPTMMSGGSQDHGMWAPSTLTSKEISSGPSENKNPLSNQERQSLIVAGTAEALEKSCTPSPSMGATKVNNSSNVACIIIESSRFAGYLIAAMGKNRAVDEHFMNLVRLRLFKFLRDKGEMVSDNDVMKMKIRQVPFQDWALRYADFLRKSIHDGHEVAMAFFPRPDIRAAMAPSPAKEMAAIHMDELPAGVRVEFNLYMHLPVNDRYVLLTPRGSVFLPVQKERLIAREVSHLHVLKMELVDLDKYRAQNFLNNKIIEFETEKDSEKESA